jgi:hypothetical protein
MKSKELELQELKAKAYDCIAHYETAIKVAEQYKESLNEINTQIVEIQKALQEEESPNLVKETE